VTKPIIAYLCAKPAADAIAFYKQAFNAIETLRMTDASGKIGHASLEIDGASFYVSDEWPEGGVYSPATLGGAAVSLCLSMADPDSAVAHAVAAGATLDRPVADQEYGERTGWITDPFGFRWSISAPIEDVSKDALQERVGAAFRVE
jgi:PhnB protein